MTLTELKYIVAVAREKHFGKAAEACFVSQPTLSVAIKKLEDELEVKLFERSANEVSVTPLGEEIVRQAQSVLEQAAAIKEIAKRGKDPLAGPLRLGVIYTIGPYLLPDLVRQAIARTPQMPLMLQENFTARLLEMLRTGEIDCAIMAEPFPDTGLAIAPLYDEPFLACLPASHPLAALDEIPLAALSEQPFILFSRKGSPDYHARIVEICRRHGFYPRLQHEGRHWLSVVSLVAQELGVSIVPAAFRQAGIQGAAFRPLAEAIEASAVFAAWRQDGAAVLREHFLAARPTG